MCLLSKTESNLPIRVFLLWLVLNNNYAYMLINIKININYKLLDFLDFVLQSFID